VTPRAAVLPVLVLTILACVATSFAAPKSPPISNADRALGRRLVAFGSCNNCHTPGWATGDEAIAEKNWMTGSPVGFRGPWGTVYAANVRLVFQEIDENQWLQMIRTRGGQPPMVWRNLRALDPASQRAIYRYVRSLGPAGKPAPTGLHPGVEPKGPYIDVKPLTVP
jgi:mono/diheme cytochrome c family protein